MIETSDVLFALIREVSRCVPEASHYIDSLNEGITPPTFLYLVSYAGERKENAFTKSTTLEIQLIYFGRTDGYHRAEDYRERLETEKRIKGFLGGFTLPVGDRALHFSYERKNADGHLSFFITLEYRDEAPPPGYKEEQAREKAEEVAFRKVIGKGD